MVQDSEGKPRGYAFIEYEHERDMHGEFQMGRTCTMCAEVNDRL